jgi:septal ring factor EnvC (AmiA/AmiB activator)
MPRKTDFGPTGFSPEVVAQFFRTMSEFNIRLKELSVDIKDVRQELSTDLKAVQKALAEGNAMFARHTEILKSIMDWQANKERECQKHQAGTAELTKTLQCIREEIQLLKGQREGIGLFWKFLIGFAALCSAIAAIWAKH